MFVDGNNLAPDANMYDHIELEQLDYTFLDCSTSKLIMSNFDVDYKKCYDSVLSPNNQIRHHDCMWSGRCSNAVQAIELKKVHEASIPAGQSLLINSRLDEYANDFLTDREYTPRPDTPLSLDDDPPEFNHASDLSEDFSAWTMGSNKMSLAPMDSETPTHIISLIKEYLEVEDSKMHSLMPLILPGSNLNDFLEDVKMLSDFEDMDAEDDGVEESNCDSTNKIVSDDYSPTSSDLEGEIDVVSVGEKWLPINPTAKFRRALDTTLAHKISNRVVKTSSDVPDATSTKSFGSFTRSKRFCDQQRNRSPVKHPAERDETNRIEKLLRNNMERERRAMLKNLFEELKREIPNLRDREYVSEVIILRGAVDLCQGFNRKEEEIIALRKIHDELNNRVNALRKSLDMYGVWIDFF